MRSHKRRKEIYSFLCLEKIFAGSLVNAIERNSTSKASPPFQATKMAMSQTIQLAVSQSHTLLTTAETLEALSQQCRKAAKRDTPPDLILFPEAYIGGYPRGATFGSAVGNREPQGREQFLSYFKDAVDLGDTPEGAGEKWVKRELGEEEGNGSQARRGDGVREELESVARETGIFIVTGLVERAGGTLYCAVVYVCPKLGGEHYTLPTLAWQNFPKEKRS